MTDYDPLIGPDPDEWHALDDLEQVDQVLAYHRRAGTELPNEMLHATIHATVESQVTLGSEIPVAPTLQRLIDEGLNRHEAIHAVGMVLVSHMHTLMQGGVMPDGDPNVPYYDELRSLTAQRWLDETE